MYMYMIFALFLSKTFIDSADSPFLMRKKCRRCRPSPSLSLYSCILIVITFGGSGYIEEDFLEDGSKDLRR